MFSTKDAFYKEAVFDVLLLILEACLKIAKILGYSLS